MLSKSRTLLRILIRISSSYWRMFSRSELPNPSCRVLEFDMHFHNSSDPYLCRLHLRTMSTGGAHPSATEPVLFVRTSHLPRNVEGYCAYSLVLRGNLLAFTSVAATDDLGDIWSSVSIWDWCSGNLMTVRHSHRGRLYHPTV